jgi:hypothetical protein
LLQGARCDWAGSRFRVCENLWACINCSGCGRSVIGKSLISQRGCSQSSTIWLLGDLPVVKSNSRACWVCTAHANCVDVTSVNVLLGCYFTRWSIYHKIASWISCTTTSLF